MKEIEKLKQQNWDVEMGDLDRLVAALTDIQNEIGGIPVSDNTESIRELQGAVSEITAAVEKMPKDTNKTLKLILVQHERLLSFLKSVKIPEPDKPVNITPQLSNISKKIGAAASSLEKTIDSVLKAQHEEIKNVMVNLQSIIDRPKSKPTAWDFAIVRDIETDLIKRIVATPK